MAGIAQRESLEPRVFQVKGDEKSDVLLGSKCNRCHRVFFPPREWCAACCQPTCEVIELSREGKLESFALVERKQAYGAGMINMHLFKR